MTEKCSLSVSVVIPLYNEERVLSGLIEKCIDILSNDFSDFELILINDGSTDKTCEILSNYSINDSRIVVLENYINLHCAISVQRGLVAATKDFVIHDASDLSLAVEDIRSLVEKTNGLDVLILERDSSRGYNFWRRLTSFGNRFIRKILYWSYLDGIEDMNFTQIYNTKSLKSIMPLAKSPAFTTPEMIMRAKLLNLKVDTIKVKYHARTDGEGSVGKPHDILWTIYDMLRFRLKLLLGEIKRN